MANDPPSAALSDLRERNEDRIRFSRYTEYTIEHDVAEGDVRRLLKALEAALKSHRPVQLYGLVMCLNGSPGCAHGPGYDGGAHFEDDGGSWRCRDKPTAVICTACLNEDGEGVIFPCGEYGAILAALTGEEGSGG